MTSPGGSQAVKAGLVEGLQDASSAVEYGTASHVVSVVMHADDTKKCFLVKQWVTCKNNREGTAWIEQVQSCKVDHAHNGGIKVCRPMSKLGWTT